MQLELVFSTSHEANSFMETMFPDAEYPSVTFDETSEAARESDITGTLPRVLIFCKIDLQVIIGITA